MVITDYFEMFPDTVTPMLVATANDELRLKIESMMKKSIETGVPISDEDILGKKINEILI